MKSYGARYARTRKNRLDARYAKARMDAIFGSTDVEEPVLDVEKPPWPVFLGSGYSPVEPESPDEVVLIEGVGFTHRDVNRICSAASDTGCTPFEFIIQASTHVAREMNSRRPEPPNLDDAIAEVEASFF